MLCKNQNSYADKHDEGAQDHCILERVEYLLPCPVLIHQAFRNEDGVVISHAEDERGKDDVDNVEAETGDPHDTFNPYPAYRKGQESHNGQ